MTRSIPKSCDGVSAETGWADKCPAQSVSSLPHFEVPANKVFCSIIVPKSRRLKWITSQ